MVGESPTTTRAGSLGGAEGVTRARMRMIMRPMRQVSALLLCIASACSMPTSAQGTSAQGISAQGLDASAVAPVSLYIDGMC